MSRIYFTFLVVLLSNFIYAQEQLSELKIFNRVLLLTKEQYVDPIRLDPKKMLIAALDAVEKQIPELVVDTSQKDVVRVQMGSQAENFSIAGVLSLWDLSFKLRDIFRFIEPKLPKNIKPSEIEYTAVNGSLSQLDPHSLILEPKNSKEMKLATQGEFGGLGIVIGIRDGFLTVISPLEGTPADRAGLKPLDRIIKINESSTINLALDEAVDKLRGKPKTKVSVTYERKGQSKPTKVTLVRDLIKVDSVSAHLIDHQVGYVKLKAFHGNTSKDLRAAIENFGSIKGLILDMRNNPGGLLNESVSVSDLFLDGGIVVVTQSSQGTQRDEEKASSGVEKTKMPIVVLVNSGSASASEIVAGALKNRNRALIVGEQTFGKGSVQILYDFPDKSALKLTVAQYLTPGDESIQSVGITPDVLLLPAYVESKKNLLIFPQTRFREGDLDYHLDDSKRVMQHKPSYELTYVSQKLSQDELEKRTVSKALYEDFEIGFAKRLLLETNGSTRQDLLSDAKKLLPQIEEEQSKKLQTALLGLGVDWSIPKQIPSGKPQLQARLIQRPSAWAGGNLKIEIEVKNIGQEPIYRVYGTSKSQTSFLTDQEFIFGKLMPGQKRVWAANLEVSKDMLTHRDLMRVELKGNRSETLGRLDIPVDVKGLRKPLLVYQYEVLPSQNQKTKIRLKITNRGPGLAEEPVVLLKNKEDSEAFIEEGRQKLKALKPGQSQTVELVFANPSNPQAKVDLQLQLYDGVSGEFWVEDLKLQPKLRINKEPPQIKWLFDSESPIVAKDTYTIKADVLGKPDLRDVYLYVNDQKVAYKTPAQAQSKKLKIEQIIKLKPGLNRVVLVARSGETYAQRAGVVLFSGVGDPLAKNL